jgi:hypothetical protein
MYSSDMTSESVTDSPAVDDRYVSATNRLLQFVNLSCTSMTLT